MASSAIRLTIKIAFGDGLSAMQWVGLLTDASVESIDILLRDAEKVVLASVKP